MSPHLMNILKKFWQFYLSQEPVTFWAVTLAAVSALVITLLVVANLDSLPPQLPLFYSLPWGDRQLATVAQFILLPSIILLTSLINLMISWHLHTSQLLLKRVLSAASVAVTIIVLITALEILSIFIGPA